MTTIAIDTKAREMQSITQKVQKALTETGIAEGICTVYCPHTTAAITINENADPDVVHDLLLSFAQLFPDRPDFLHAEGNSAAHLAASCIGESVTVPVHAGKLCLGTWQGIYFCEFDGPRHRRFMVQAVGR